MNPTTNTQPKTEADARKALDAAERHYLEIEAQLKTEPPGLSTADRVVRETELNHAIVDAAGRVAEARAEYEELRNSAIELRQEEAVAELAAIEAELARLTVSAEDRGEQLAELLLRILELSRRRYALRQEATGRAPQSMLARNAVAGWLMWMVQELDLPDFNAPHHYRDQLAHLLGLPPVGTSDVGEDDDE